MPPFTREMARRHKHGLSAKQQRQWVAVARSQFATCKSKGGSDSTCEAQAIRAANGVTGTPELSTERRLVIQAELTVPPHRHNLHNREHLVAPAVLIVEGVLNNAYIPGVALMPDLWDGMPVVIGHPINAQGVPISARSPEVYDQYGIGHVYRTQVSTGQRGGVPVRSLLAELWLDMDRVEALGGEALQAMEMVENEMPLEISTGFYSAAVSGPGTFQNVPYVETLMDIRPDHLALLPNSIGACSWSDGCGIPRLHVACGCGAEPCSCKPASVSESKPNSVRRLIQRLQAFLAQEDPEPPHPPPDPDDEPPPEEDEDEEESLTAETVLIEDLYACVVHDMGSEVTPCTITQIDPITQSFLVHQGEQAWRRYWQTVDGRISLTDDRIIVEQEPPERTVPGTDEREQEENSPMTMQGKVPSAAIKARVNGLINNERTTWTERERHYLEQQEEGFLILLEQQPLIPEPPKATAPPRIYEAFEGLDSEATADLVDDYVKRKDAALTTLLTHENCAFGEDELRKMSAKKLEGILAMMGIAVPGRTLVTPPENYSGRRVPQIRIVQGEDEGVPPTPDTLTLVVQKRRELGLMN